MAAMVGQLLIGWLVADFLSGLVHWLEDRVARRSWPYFGTFVVVPNRRHHAEPLHFLKGTIIARNGASWVLTMTLASIWAVTVGWSWTLASATLGGIVVNEVHRLAHAPKLAPAWLRALQQTGIVQSPTEHARHHRPPSEQRFCVLTNWLNPVLDLAGFWRGMGRAFAAIGIAPHDGTR